MSQAKDEEFNQLLKQVAKSYADSEDEKNKTAQLRLMLAILGVLAFVGYEAVKVLFRKNFGMSTGAMIRLVLCFFCFAGIAILSFSNACSEDAFATESGTSDSHFIFGMAYSILALFILVRGVTGRNRQDNYYSGDSTILGFLIKEGWTKPFVQYLAEPLLVLSLGIAVCFFDRIGGIPLIFCAVSAWVDILFTVMFRNSSMENSVNQINQQSNPKKGFYEIETDVL